MPNRRKEILATGEIYHIYNRSISNTEIFISKRSLNHALELIRYYKFHQAIRLSKFHLLSNEARMSYLESIDRNNPLIEIFAFALMPNHLHFLLKQMQDGGIREFLSNFQNGFAKYYNLRQNREGGLFQSPFKSKRVAKDADLLQVSRYIHLNPVTSFLVEFPRLKDYPFTSFPDYIKENTNSFIKTDLIINLAGSMKNYLKFVSDRVDYQRKLESIKHLVHD